MRHAINVAKHFQPIMCIYEANDMKFTTIIENFLKEDNIE